MDALKLTRVDNQQSTSLVIGIWTQFLHRQRLDRAEPDYNLKTMIYVLFFTSMQVMKWQKIIVHPSGTETGIFRVNYTNVMVNNDPAHCVTRSSATMSLTVPDSLTSLYLQKGSFFVLVPSQCSERIKMQIHVYVYEKRKQSIGKTLTNAPCLTIFWLIIYFLPTWRHFVMLYLTFL